jgi:hypothetical protein
VYLQIEPQVVYLIHGPPEALRDSRWDWLVADCMHPGMYVQDSTGFRIGVALDVSSSPTCNMVEEHACCQESRNRSASAGAAAI